MLENKACKLQPTIFRGTLLGVVKENCSGSSSSPPEKISGKMNDTICAVYFEALTVVVETIKVNVSLIHTHTHRIIGLVGPADAG